MKFLLILMLFFVGCDNHKRPQRNRAKLASTDSISVERQVLHTDTVIVNIPCPPCIDYSKMETMPKYFCIIIDKEYFNVIAGLLDAATADEADESLNKSLWDYLRRHYPEVKSNEPWSLIRSGDIMYIRRTENQ